MPRCANRNPKCIPRLYPDHATAVASRSTGMVEELHLVSPEMFDVTCAGDVGLTFVEHLCDCFDGWLVAWHCNLQSCITKLVVDCY